MGFSERIGHFVLFVVLTVITLGVYPLYFAVTTTRENNILLREIRDSLQEDRKRPE